MKKILFPVFLLLLVIFTASLIVISGCGSVTSGGGGGGGGGGGVADGVLFVSDHTNKKILAIDTKNRQVVASLELTGATYPSWMALNPAGNKLYVADETKNCIFVISATVEVINSTIEGVNPTIEALLAKIKTVEVCSTPRGMTFNSDASKLYVACSVGQDVAIIDTATNTYSSQIYNLSADPHGIAYDASHNRIYVASYGGNCIDYITAVATVFSASIPLSKPYDVAVSPNGGILYATTWSDSPVGYLASFDTSSNSMISSWEARVGGTPTGNNWGFRNLVVSPDGKYICSTMHDYSYIDVFDTQVATLEPITAHSQGPGMVAFSTDSSRAYAITQSNWIDIIDPAAGTNVGSIELPSGSYFGVAFHP